LKVLQDTLELQYAALDSYQSVAAELPTELTLNSINFERGRKVTVFGTASMGEVAKINDFNSKLIVHEVRGQRLYLKVNPPNIQNNQAQSVMSWNFACDLKRSEVGE
jgi:hypothetical protein